MKTSARIVAVASALILAGPIAISTAVASTPGPTVGVDSIPASCGGRQLDVKLGRLGAAAGSKYQAIRFTNASQRRCTLQGHPRVSFRGRHGVRIGWPADRTGHGGPVVLRPGRTAKAVLQIPDWHNFPRRDCHAKGSPRLRVVPPGTQRTVGFHYPAKTCTTKQGRSFIRPVRLVR